jgi:hypothetical protein
LAQSIPPVRQLNLGGVFTGGDAFRRPGDTAVRCLNLRPMPGGRIRLRGGWERRAAASGSREYLQFHEFRKGSLSAGVYHLAQTTDGTAEAWHQLNLSNYSLTQIDAVNGTAGTKPRAIANVRDRVFFDNGLGIRDNLNSRPPLSSWDGTSVRYVGLDAYCPTGANPTATFAAGAGLNNIIASLTIYVGLYSSATNHYGNGVLAGKITNNGSSTITGTVSLSNLSRLSCAFHGIPEQAELYYVFYSTGDGLSVPYLILNAAGTDVYKVSVANLSASLSLTAADSKGFIISPAHEMPTENFPPRPLEDVCYANGRLYGIPGTGGSGSAASYAGFAYPFSDRDAAAIVYSATADDVASQDTAFVGVPEESWPATNKKFCPNGERPIKVSDLPNRGQVLVITATGTFYLEETADGLHVWQPISETRGILDKRSFARTPRGPMWVTQHKEIVLLDPSSMSLQVQSTDYAEIINESVYNTGAFGVAADYVLDPVNFLDQYQVWAASGYWVIHDFALAADQERRGVTVAPGYGAFSSPINCAKTLADASAQYHHLAGKGALWTREAQPQGRLVPTRDQDANGAFTDIVGDWIGQWLNYGDPRVKKEIREILLIGDAAFSTALNTSPVLLTWFGDLDSTENQAELVKSAQSPTDYSYVAKVKNGNLFWIKLRIQLTGHSSDATTYYPVALSWSGELDLSQYIYGSIVEVALTVNSAGQNRP